MNDLQQSFNHMIKDIVDYLWDLYKVRPTRIRVYDAEFDIQWIVDGVYHNIAILYDIDNDIFTLLKYRNHKKTDSYRCNHLDAVFNQIQSIIYYIKPRMVY